LVWEDGAEAVMVMRPPEGAAALVVAVNLAVLEPAGTVTVAGTVATAVLLLLRVTVNPPLGAAAERVMVPVAGFGWMTVVGLKIRLVMVSGFTVSVADL